MVDQQLCAWQIIGNVSILYGFNSILSNFCVQEKFLRPGDGSSNILSGYYKSYLRNIFWQFILYELNEGLSQSKLIFPLRQKNLFEMRFIPIFSVFVFEVMKFVCLETLIIDYLIIGLILWHPVVAEVLLSITLLMLLLLLLLLLF